MEEDIKSFIKVWVSAIASLTYSYFISTKIPKPILRIFSLLPVFYLFITLPLQISSFHLGAPTILFLVWLGNFKLLLFTFNQGPLSQTSNLFHFLAVASLPIKIKQNPTQKSPNHKHSSNKITQKTHPSSQNPNFTRKDKKFTLKPSLLLAIKVAILAFVIKSYKYKPKFPQCIILILYCIHLYTALEIVLAISAIPVKIIFGFELEPQFNEPYLATSLQDFWGRRWNLMVSSILRLTVYDPIRTAFEPVVGHAWAKVDATVAAFTVSGLMHEVIYFYFSRVRPTWEVTWFFVLHGFCVAAEAAAKGAFSGKWRLNRAVSGALTLGFLAVTGYWWFFPQIIRNGVVEKAIGEYYTFGDFVWERISKLL